MRRRQYASTHLESLYIYGEDGREERELEEEVDDEDDGAETDPLPHDADLDEGQQRRRHGLLDEEEDSHLDSDGAEPDAHTLRYREIHVG